jgi:acyl-CoA thioester hydrolase
MIDDSVKGLVRIGEDPLDARPSGRDDAAPLNPGSRSGFPMIPRGSRPRLQPEFFNLIRGVPLNPYQFVQPVPVRFSDIDVGGHAHHGKVLSYLEEARWSYWTRIAGRPAQAEAVDYILSEVRVRYRARILYPNELLIGVRADEIGRKHVTLSYEVRSGGGAFEEGDRLAEASTVLVLYDYRTGETVSVPETLRARLEAYEGRPLPRRDPAVRDPR